MILLDLVYEPMGAHRIMARFVNGLIITIRTSVACGSALGFIT